MKRFKVDHYYKHRAFLDVYFKVKYIDSVFEDCVFMEVKWYNNKVHLMTHGMDFIKISLEDLKHCEEVIL